jgi:hypothetical protein
MTAAGRRARSRQPPWYSSGSGGSHVQVQRVAG